MKKSILSLAAAAALSGTIALPAQAEDVKVKEGDTLWGLSQKYEVSVDQIKSWNHLSSDTIRTGEQIQISKEKTYIIKSGDTLGKIAGKYGVSVNDLKSWNGLSSDLIHEGNQLVIQPAADKVQGATDQVKETAAAQPVSSPQPEEQSQPEKTEAPAAETPVKPSESKVQKEITVSATAYTASCDGCSGVTATGLDLKANSGQKVIAVDPSVIPLGSKVEVEGYGTAIAGDTGSAIKGNRIDVFVPNKQDAVNWGVKTVKVKVLN
ncbi:3D domain-containing protein [Bacillus massiliglaciei]|uniref:3D domain-containing protein n=1 Tax=Bacillus massiliglaciei TaxID=1816693 RepID=UPI000ABB2215|nr:3D domain-containing protein [Bacillus massiliglaciei]